MRFQLLYAVAINLAYTLMSTVEKMWYVGWNCTAAKRLVQSETLHVMTGSDSNQIMGIVGLIVSIIHSSKPNESVAIHVLVDSESTQLMFENIVSKMLAQVVVVQSRNTTTVMNMIKEEEMPNARIIIDVRVFRLLDAFRKILGVTEEGSSISDRIKKEHTNYQLLSATNYARFFINSLAKEVAPLPNHPIRRMAWLDADIVLPKEVPSLNCCKNVNHSSPLSALFRCAECALSKSINKVAAIIPRNDRSICHDNNHVHQVRGKGPIICAALRSFGLSRDKADQSRVNFNAGVMVIDIQRWQSAHITDKIIFWLTAYRDRIESAHRQSDTRIKHKKLWTYDGSNSPLLLALWKEQLGFLDSAWNCAHFIANDNYTMIHTCALFHFSGSVKPWERNPFSSVWLQPFL